MNTRSSSVVASLFMLLTSSVDCLSPDSPSGDSVDSRASNLTSDALVGKLTSNGEPAGGWATARAVRVAWLGNTPDNTYDNATLTGATLVATALRSTVKPYYCQYDPVVQLDQCNQAVQSGQVDAILMNANDGVSIIPCVTLAATRGIPVVATDLPIGPDSATTSPQVPGQVGAALTPAAKFAATLGPVVGSLCDRIGPCNIVYLAGSFGINYDIMAIAALNGLLQSHPNIHIVAQREAFYDQATARSIVQDILSKNTNIQVVVAAGDQMARGAEEAVAAAGPLPNRIEIIGGGASAYAVKAIRAGRWYGTFVTLPFDEGAYGVWMGIRAARHQSLLINGVDPVALRGLPAFMTADNLAAFQGFIPEWPG